MFIQYLPFGGKSIFLNISLDTLILRKFSNTEIFKDIYNKDLCTHHQEMPNINLIYIVICQAFLF